MTRATGIVTHRITMGGRCLIIALCLVWALFERRAPFVNVRWRDGLSVETRRQHEIDLHLVNGEPSGDAWRYELASPRPADIRAIVRHPDVRDTHRIDRDTGTLSADGGYGTVRVWWRGPFVGVHGPLQFRALLAGVTAITLVCAVVSSRNARKVRRPVLQARGRAFLRSSD